ncbi:MAG TPA: CpaF family protein [Alphaproteobacteria bacterium]|jgi:pilus assembly protein CpaF
MSKAFGLRNAPTAPAPAAPSVAPAPPEPRPLPHMAQSERPTHTETPARHRLQDLPTNASARDVIRDQVIAAVETEVAVRLSPTDLLAHVEQAISTIANERRFLLNAAEQRNLAREIVDDMLGLGPLEPLLHDENVSDILVNGPKQVYVERRGKLQLTDTHFRSADHVMHVIQRIAIRVNRPIDEASPMLDARLEDGSRVNAIIWPLTVKGPNLSIRKFSKRFFGLDEFVARGSISPNLAKVLKIAARCRLNIVISGGTGSGKTTLLNAMSESIDHDERIITIEDAVELQLQQPHVVQLETRPPNIEGRGQVVQRDLVKNALRMRPDRIILGEVRGAEALDMLQAMNTGHNGSMSTVHANSPRDALARIENLVLMANVDLPARSIRGQLASAFDLIVQIERMRDGVRRVTEVMEVVGMEQDTITTQPLVSYHYLGENPDGTLRGVFRATGTRPRFMSRLGYFGLDKAFVEALATETVDD